MLGLALNYYKNCYVCGACAYFHCYYFFIIALAALILSPTLQIVAQLSNPKVEMH